MKQLPTILNILLGAILMALLLPDLSVRAITPTPAPLGTDTPTPALLPIDTPTPAPVESASTCDSTRTVQTSGVAVVNIVPDRALIQLGVQSNATTTAEVQKSNNAAMQKVMDALAGLEIESKDIATDWYYVEPVYSSYDSLSIKGYRISNTVAITLRDVKRVNEVISEALDAGANQVINVELYTSELRKYRDQAREMAVQAAKEKADLLAAAAGAETGCVVTISENVWSYYNGWYGRAGTSNVWSQNVAQNAGPAGESALSEAGAVTLGQISIRAEVAATFGLR